MSMVPRAAIILGYPINTWDNTWDDFEDFIISDVHEQNYFGKVLTTIDEHTEPILLDEVVGSVWTYDEIFAAWDKFIEEHPDYKETPLRKWLIFQWD